MLGSPQSVSLAALRAKGIVMTTPEALAVAQSLFESRADDARPPFGPLSAGNIVLRSDGSVASTACATTPTVLEAAVLLDALLPDGPAQVPGALRYTLGRALHEVAAPPFDSLADFSRALRRFEAGPRAAIVRVLYGRADDPPAVVESAWQAVGLPFAAALLAGVALIGAGEAMHIDRLAPVASTRAIDARPIVFNPPLVIVRAPAVSFSVTPPAPRRQPIVRADTRPARRAGLASRIFGRFKIKFDEL